MLQCKVKTNYPCEQNLGEEIGLNHSLGHNIKWDGYKCKNMKDM